MRSSPRHLIERKRAVAWIRTWDRQTALLFGHFAVAVVELGVCDERGSAFTVVEHEELERHADLRPGEADARRLIHRLRHVLREPAKRPIEMLDRLRGFTQHRIAKPPDG